MKRVIGFGMLCGGCGLVIAIILPKILCAILTAVFVLVGYNLFCCK